MIWWWRARVRAEEEEEHSERTLPGSAPVEFSPKVEIARVSDRKKYRR